MRRRPVQRRGVAVDAAASPAYPLDMPSHRSPGWKDLRTGVAVLAVLIPLVAGIFFLDAIRRAVVEGPSLVIAAEEIEGLVPGSDVWVAGRPSGRVTDVTFLADGGVDGRRVAVRVVLRRDAGPALRRDAEARIGSSALLAPPVVKLRPGSPTAPAYDFADTLPVAARPDLDDFRALADSGRAVVAALGTELEGLGAEIRTGSGTLPRLRRDGALRADFARQRTRAATLRSAWRREAGVRALLADTALRARAGRIAKRLDALAADSALGRVRERRRELRAALQGLAERKDRLADRIDAGDGTLGRFATDEELREQAARTRALVDSVRADLLEDPLHYLRFRLF